MLTKINCNKKSIHFKLMVGKQYQNTFLPVSKFYNKEDKVDESKMNKMFDNVFTTCSKLMNQSKKIDNITLDTIKLEYGKDLCSNAFIMHEHNDGPYEEYALSTEIPPSLLSINEVDTLDTSNKENTPPPVLEIVDVKPKPIDHNINCNQVETGYYHPIQVIIDDKINTKERMKIDSIKLKEKEQFFSWYINCTLHCALLGIYILQIDCTEKDNTMGKDWSMKHVGMENFCLRNHMSALVSKLLKTDDLIAKDLTKLKSKVTSGHGDGYAVLYNIKRYVKHPNFIKDEVETSIPCQHNSETFTSYINRIQNFIQ
eukprot:8998545-Ditylum_brightwellii.AAC.1